MCKKCQNNFDILIKEYNRHIRLGRNKDHFFCSLSCARSYGNRNLSPESREKMSKLMKERLEKNNYFKDSHKSYKKGEFTYFLNKAKQRSHEVDIDEEYLKSIWTGRCAITNVPIIMKQAKIKNTLSTASLDRIDSSIGYVKGNVQFVSYGINLAKNSFKDNDMRSFIDNIVEHYQVKA